MADVTWSFNMVVNKGAFNVAPSVAGATADMSEAGRLAVTPTLTTSPQAVTTTSLTSLGLCMIRNLATATTHTITFGRWDGATLTPIVEPRGGEPAGPFRLAPGSYAIKAAVTGTRAVIEILEG